LVALLDEELQVLDFLFLELVLVLQVFEPLVPAHVLPLLILNPLFRAELQLPLQALLLALVLQVQLLDHLLLDPQFLLETTLKLAYRVFQHRQLVVVFALNLCFRCLEHLTEVLFLLLQRFLHVARMLSQLIVSLVQVFALISEFLLVILVVLPQFFVFLKKLRFI